MFRVAGGLLVGVPGEIAGLRELHARFGRLQWSDLVMPVADMALEGFRVSALMARAMDRAQNEFGVDQLVNIRCVSISISILKLKRSLIKKFNQ